MKTIAILMAMAAFTTTAVFGADAKAGQAVYDKSCKTCHGADGTPNPAIVKMTKVDIKDLKSTDADVKKVITEGQGKMKPMPSITGSSLDDVVAYVHSLKK
jgi:predicted CXXCH cytochrome family protein